MVELPTTKQWRADRFSAVRSQGIFGESVNVLTGDISSRSVAPSCAKDVLHGFGYISRFFPAGKELTAPIEQRLWDRLYSPIARKEVIVFEDQYISTAAPSSQLFLLPNRLIT